MTADSQFAVQQAVYTALRTNAALSAFVGESSGSPTVNRVYDGLSRPDPTYPFVVIGGTTARADDTKDSDGMDLDVMIHSFSRYAGNKELRQIMGAIVDALDRQALSLTGHTLVQLRFEFSDVMDDPDGLTRHGVQRFRAFTEAA